VYLSTDVHPYKTYAAAYAIDRSRFSSTCSVAPTRRRSILLDGRTHLLVEPRELDVVRRHAVVEHVGHEEE